MEFEALKDFELYSKVSEDIIVKYEGKIPEQFLNIWKKYGFGQFLQGYFGQSVIPNAPSIID